MSAPSSPEPAPTDAPTAAPAPAPVPAPTLAKPAPPRHGRAALLYLTGTTLVVASVILAVTMSRGKSATLARERDQRARTVGDGPRVLVVHVTETPPGRALTLAGDVRAFRQTTLYAKVSGYLQTIKVDKGDAVKAGQLIGVVESPETDQQLLSTQAALASRQETDGRYRALAPSGVVSKLDLEHAGADVKVAQAEVARVRALKQYEAIRAPFDGVVTARYVDPGALIPAATGSTQSAQPLIDLADLSKVRIYFYLGQNQAPFVHEGDAATISTDADPHGKLSAQVTRISRSLDLRTRTMLAEIDLDNAKAGLYPGLYVKVGLTIASPPSLAVAADALFMRGGKPQLALVQNGHVKFVAVETGDDDGKNVAILSGVTKGDVVALQAGDEVSDGAPVQPIERELPKPPGH